MVNSEWVRIGGYSYTADDMGQVPQWVRDQMGALPLSGAASDGKYYELKGKNFRYRIVPQGHGAPIVNIYRRPRSGQSTPPTHDDAKKRRRRATAVVMRDGKYLLVRDKGRHHYSLPGGGIEREEPALAAVAREVYEETRLNPVKAEYLFTHKGTVNDHQVVLVNVDGNSKVKLQRKELDAYQWWDGVSPLPVNQHVTDILARVAGTCWSRELPRPDAGNIHS